MEQRIEELEYEETAGPRPFASLPLDLRRRAEAVLEAQGMSLADAEVLFWREVVQRNGMPFEVPPLPPKLLCVDDLTPEQLEAELQKDREDIRAGNFFTWEEVEAELARDYGI